MSVRLDVPFYPDGSYVDLLKAEGASIDSIHYSLYSELIPDARYRSAGLRAEAVIPFLKQCGPAPKYILLNSRFHSPASLLDPDQLKAVWKAIECFLREGLSQGLVFADPYLLTALSDASPASAAELEALPSVNFMLDSPARAAAVLDLIAETAFRPPSRLILDRSLNRQPRKLAEAALACRRRRPEIKLGLLANEGCLEQCPFKPAHDAHIALAGLGYVPEQNARMNAELGCRRVLARRPEAAFRSPFIRPEDTCHYEGVIDLFKVCGRALGPDFLSTAVRAYLDGHYRGNLLSLTDTMTRLAGRWEVLNQDLPTDFWNRLTSCEGDCDSCGYCGRLWKSLARPLEWSLKDLRAARRLVP